MRDKLTIVAVMVSICAGCTAPQIRGVADRNKVEVREVLAPDFKFPSKKEEETYSLLSAAQRLLEPGEKIESVRFKDATHATVFLSPPTFSIHGGPFIEAVWDRGEWKFGAKWSLL